MKETLTRKDLPAPRKPAHSLRSPARADRGCRIALTGGPGGGKSTATYPRRILLCDRGTVDGAAYWPPPSRETGDFFEALGTSLEDELARYDAVIFFESAAVGGMEIESGNPVRIESHAEASTLDRALRDLWCQHPRFVFVPHAPSFFEKIATGLGALTGLVADLRAERELS